MIAARTPVPRRLRLLLATLTVVGSLGTACSSTAAESPVAAAATAASATSGANGATAATEAAAVADEASVFLAADEVHDIEVTFDRTAYDEMVATYSSTGDKDWIEATVTIDGTTYQRVGMRLKGNSSLRGLASGAGASTTTTSPTDLPWLIRLDRYIDGQDHDGLTDLVVRANSSETALNEAVALDLLRAAGLASQRAAYVRLEVNGADPTLRLVIENPDEEWQDANFDGIGILYKAESTGDYSYRGDDPEAYDEVFDQETGNEDGADDLEPLIDLLEFINNAEDATFAAELADRLDVDAFARYLAFEELIDNFDDIDGPGNNSYLYWDEATDRFTVVAWDHNLAFGASPGGPGGAGGAGGAGGGAMQPPPGMGAPPAGMAPPAGGAGGPGGPAGRSNVLVQRFTANASFNALVTEAKADLTATLFSSGTAAASLESWTDLLERDASDLVPTATVSSEATRVAGYFS